MSNILSHIKYDFKTPLKKIEGQKRSKTEQNRQHNFYKYIIGITQKLFINVKDENSWTNPKRLASWCLG